MMIYLILTIIGSVLLIMGADLLVDGANEVSKRFNIPSIIVGLSIVAIGTSMSELVKSCKASLEGNPSMALTNIIGSNITDLFLALGIAVLIRPIKFTKQTKYIDNMITVLVSILLFCLCNIGNNILTRKDASILIFLGIIFFTYLIIMSRKQTKKETEIVPETIAISKPYTYIFNIIAGIIILKFGGDLIINNISNSALILGLHEHLIEEIRIIFCSCLPELATTLNAAKKGYTDIAIGNIIGSQVFNILLIVGFSASLNSITYSMNYNEYLLILILGNILLALFPFVGKKDKMTRAKGCIFLFIFIAYIINIVIKTINYHF